MESISSFQKDLKGFMGFIRKWPQIPEIFWFKKKKPKKLD